MTNVKLRLEFLLFFFLLFMGLTLRHPGLLLLALPLAWHVLLSAGFFSPELSTLLAATRTVTPSRAQDGDVIEVTIRVSNRGPVALEVFVTDESAPGLEVCEGCPFASAVLAPAESLTLNYRVRARRGLYLLRGVQVEAKGPFSLMTMRGEISCPGQILVLPRFERGLSLEATARRALPIPGTARSLRAGLGVEFHSVREFRPGDQARKLAWKAMARHDTPLVVEFLEERATEVAMILDTRERVYRAEEGLFEHAVRAAATLAHHFLRQGHRVALLQYGTFLDWVFPGYGKRHEERILRELAEAKLGESEVFAELSRLPTRLFPSGSLLVIISPLILGDEEVLGLLVARGYKVWVILPEGSALDQEGAEERELARRILELERRALLRRVRKSGAVVVVWRVDRPLGVILRRARKELCR